METPLPAPAQPGQKTNGLALTAGILGIGSIVVSLLGFLLNFVLPVIGLGCGCGLGLLMAIVGLILGFIGQAQIKNRPGEKGKGMAVTGIVIGALTILTACVLTILVVVGGPIALTIFGPVIGNVFSEINSQLLILTPVP